MGVRPAGPSFGTQKRRVLEKLQLPQRLKLSRYCESQSPRAGDADLAGANPTDRRKLVDTTRNTQSLRAARVECSPAKSTAQARPSSAARLCHAAAGWPDNR